MLFNVAPYVGAWIETKRKKTAGRQYPVAPYVGAWIETKGETFPVVRTSCVAPYVGAWIETLRLLMIMNIYQVAPYVGAWIETDIDICKKFITLRRTLRGCVD